MISIIFNLHSDILFDVQVVLVDLSDLFLLVDPQNPIIKSLNKFFTNNNVIYFFGNFKQLIFIYVCNLHQTQLHPNVQVGLVIPINICNNYNSYINNYNYYCHY